MECAGTAELTNFRLVGDRERQLRIIKELRRRIDAPLGESGHTELQKGSYFLARVEHYLPINDFEDAITMELRSLYRRMELKD